MPVIWRCNNDCIEIFPRQEIGVVQVSCARVTIGLLGRRHRSKKSRSCHFSDADDMYVVPLHQGVHQPTPADAVSNHADPDRLVGER
jgi:hypothetical protein